MIIEIPPVDSQFIKFIEQMHKDMFKSLILPNHLISLGRSCGKTMMTNEWNRYMIEYSFKQKLRINKLKLKPRYRKGLRC